MILLLEVKLIGSGWLPRRILDEDDIRKALDNLVLDQNYYDWRVRKIHRDDVVAINAQIATQWR
jgi:hypothetical protein